MGSGGGSQEFTEEQYRLFFHQQYKQMSLFCVPTGVMGSLSSELSVRFGLRGPSHVVTTGCTSSTDGVRLFRAPDSVRTARYDSERRSRCAHRTGNREGLHPDENLDRLLEPCAGARFAAILRRSRWLRGGRRRVDVCAGRIRTCTGARRKDTGRDLRIWIDLRSVSPRPACRSVARNQRERSAWR